MSADTPAPDPDLYVLWCAACRRRLPASGADLARFAADGWPRCCDRQMMIYSSTDYPPRAECGCCDRRP